MRKETRQKLIGAGIAIMVLVALVMTVAMVDADGDGTAPKTAGYANADCVYTASGLILCEGSPVASPVPVTTPTLTPIVIELPTVAPTPTLSDIEEVLAVDTLPGTGAGTTANVQTQRAHGWMGYAAYSQGCNVYGRHYWTMYYWHHYWHFAYGGYTYFSGEDWRC